MFEIQIVAAKSHASAIFKLILFLTNAGKLYGVLLCENCFIVRLGIFLVRNRSDAIYANLGTSL